MRLTEAAEPVFARHETFHPRYGWFRKSYSAAGENREIFKAQAAPVVLGVGKNMVKSIKFWGQAAKIITKDPHSPTPRAPGMVPTRFGQALFGNGGWDPYMEDPGTLWVLHWLLLAPPSLVPVWWLSFNELHAIEFDEATLDIAVASQLEASGWKTPLQSSVKKDISVLFRTYAPALRARRVVLDDLLDCPLRELGLLTRSSATGKYRFVVGRKPSLPNEIIAYAVLDYLSRRDVKGNTVTLAHLANEVGGPGRAFKLSASDLYEALVPITSHMADLILLSPTGAQQLGWKKAPGVIAVDVLNAYYGVKSSLEQTGSGGDDPVVSELARSQGSSRQGALA